MSAPTAADSSPSILGHHAAARGVTVVATGIPDDAGRLTKLGAATIVDHTKGPVAEQVLAVDPGGVDALIELAAQSPDASPLAAVCQGGKAVGTTMGVSEQVLTARGLAGGTVMAQPVREVTAPLAGQAAAGALTVDVETVLPLEQAADGLAIIAAGKARGKIVVQISD